MPSPLKLQMGVCPHQYIAAKVTPPPGIPQAALRLQPSNNSDQGTFKTRDKGKA